MSSDEPTRNEEIRADEEGPIDDDELVEVTPGAIRIRKKQLKEIERKRAARKTG